MIDKSGTFQRFFIFTIPCSALHQDFLERGSIVNSRRSFFVIEHFCLQNKELKKKHYVSYVYYFLCVMRFLSCLTMLHNYVTTFYFQHSHIALFHNRYSTQLKFNDEHTIFSDTTFIFWNILISLFFEVCFLSIFLHDPMPMFS